MRLPALVCFIAGTLVHTKEGLRPIEQIRVGDYVLSKPENGEGEVTYKRVINTFEFEDKETWFVSWQILPSPSEMEHIRSLVREKKRDELQEVRHQKFEEHGQSFVVTTPNHPFWVLSSPEDLCHDERYSLCSTLSAPAMGESRSSACRHDFATG
ncbi:MAG: Hint domain-containing protein [Betaproteobacteria bacterium]|nr:Hint domain-containing protein [Betaproteobacteria bacterium]